MEHLWTPWRMPYLQGKEGRTEGCLFCIAPQVDGEGAYIVHRTELCYAILNRYPYNDGHLMIVPFAHLATLEDLDAGTMGELMALTQRSLQVLRLEYEPDGFNVGVNIGEVAGAGVADHVHVHIVPRWRGDNNYISTVGKTRVIPEWLDQTYERLRPLFESSGME
jgi:ATP adenylyltransferase